MRPGTLADLVATAKLGHQLPAIDFNSDCMEPLDLPEDVRTRRGTHARLMASDKAIEWVASVDEDVDDAERINEILFGAELAPRPRALIVLNTTAPLQLSGETARILLRWARLGQPACVTSCVMGGTTGPATLAGVLAVQHAEVLAALVLAQAAREGSPFVYGGVSVMASLRTGAALVRHARVLAAGASRPRGWRICCGLPVRAGAAVTDAHAVDARAMAESAAGLSAAVFAGAHFLFQAAGMLSSFNALSLEKYVLDADLIDGAARRGATPCRAGDDDLAEDVIDAVGPGGGYLGQAHTRRHARDYERAGRGSRPSPSSAGPRRAARTPSPPPPAASRTSSPRTSRRTTSTRSRGGSSTSTAWPEQDRPPVQSRGASSRARIRAEESGEPDSPEPRLTDDRQGLLCLIHRAKAGGGKHAALVVHQRRPRRRGACHPATGPADHKGEQRYE